MLEYKLGHLNGKFVVTWMENGKRRRIRLSANTKREAVAEADKIIRMVTTHGNVVTVAHAWEQYAAYLGDRPGGKQIHYTGKAILPFFGPVPVEGITIDMCREYTRKRLDQGKSVGTAWTELGNLRSALSWCAKMRIIPYAPHIEKPQKPAPKDRYLTREEISQLLGVDMEPHTRLAILLLLTTAARVSAVLDLTWDRVDLEKGIINLRREADAPRKGRAIVPINNSLHRALVEARDIALGDYVVSRSGQQIKCIRKGFISAAHRAGLDDIDIHSLRHTAAVHMAEAGVPMQEISQYLGHSNTSITAHVYARFSPGYLSKAASALDFDSDQSKDTNRYRG